MLKIRLLLVMVLIITLLTLSLPLSGCKRAELFLSVTTPSNGDTFTEPTIVVKGRVWNGNAVWVNDTTVELKKGNYSTEVTLAEGENEIKVVAAQGKPGKWSNTLESVLAVTYIPN